MENTDSSNKQELEKQAEAAILPDIPDENKVQHILQTLEIISMQKGEKTGIDIHAFSPQQLGRLLDMMAKREGNVFELDKKRLEIAREIEVKKIQAKTTNQFTVRYSVIGGLLIFTAVTLSVLFFKDAYFVPWLTFLTGLAGGFGLGKISKAPENEPEKNPLVKN